MKDFKPYSWTCPHCGTAQIITAAQVWESTYQPVVTSKHLEPHVNITVQSCANNLCREISIITGFSSRQSNPGQLPVRKSVFLKRIYPDGTLHETLHESVPEAIIEDYNEGWAISELSPKAAATLARRALQGMIRDFSGIAKATLDLEIRALRDAVSSGSAPLGVTPESVEAIDHVRKIGNIGAHMERDINIIIPVEADEAKTLLKLVELLAKEWYQARAGRKAMLEELKAIRLSKAQTSSSSTTIASSGTPPATDFPASET